MNKKSQNYSLFDEPEIYKLFGAEAERAPGPKPEPTRHWPNKSTMATNEAPPNLKLLLIGNSSSVYERHREQYSLLIQRQIVLESRRFLCVSPTRNSYPKYVESFMSLNQYCGSK
jgi:hypothetical protein